jgi:hypothetical protein
LSSLIGWSPHRSLHFLFLLCLSFNFSTVLIS